MAAAAAGAGFLLLPIVAIAARTPWADALRELSSRESRDAVALSIECSLAATAIGLVLGVPLAFVLARYRFPGRRLLRAATALPMVLPPVVGGVALLLAFGRRGLVGAPLLSLFGIQVTFTTTAAILAEAFVGMPFLVITVEAGLRGAGTALEEAARTLGADRWTVIRRVTLPVAMPSIAAGAILCWSRALGEFGATITFAGNFPGQTQTVPLAVYVLLESRPEASFVLSVVMVVVSLAVLAGMRSRYLGTA